MSFTGFSTDAAAFLTGLAADNSKAFFDSHREDYRRLIRQPMEDLLGEVEATYGPGKVMRPNRDVRFSNNKEPYRTDASMWSGGVGGVYLRLSSGGLEIGGGLYDPTRDQLERARTGIAERPLVAAELERIIEGLTASRYEMAGPSLKTAPRGFDRDHPAIELLRLKHYAALRHSPVDASRAEILDGWKRAEPLIGWVEANVGAAVSTP